MYQQHFNLRELPFSIAPDPRFLYMSAQHREALAHLAYGMNADGGFILLTGEVGMGKTTICRCLLEQIPENVDVAFILNPKMTVEELLETICDELGIMYPQGNTSVKVFIDRINAYLLDAFAGGRKTILIIEEAQHLDADVLEQIRLLTNLETSRQKLLQIIMIGQPELRDILSRQEMLPLSQRITARYHIGPLPKNEIGAYVRHRLSVAGAQDKIFPDSLSGILYRLSRGIPRLINVICDRALLGAYVQGKGSVDRKTLLKAAQEVLGQNEVNRFRKSKMRWMTAGFVLVFCGAAIAGVVYHYKVGSPVFTQEVVSKEAVRHAGMKVAEKLEWPSEQPLESSKHSAYEAIFQEWNIPYEKKVSGDVCRQALGKGLRCLDGPGDLKSLITLNRPAVLELIDDQGKEFYGVLKAVEGNTAIFVLGSEIRTVDFNEIGKKWFGDYLLLWKAPEAYRRSISPGDRGLAVEWVDRKLSSIEGLNNGSWKRSYDDDLVRRVKRFQLAEGLVPDGIVGSQTIILLNNKSGSDEPLLTRSAEVH